MEKAAVALQVQRAEVSMLWKPFMPFVPFMLFMSRLLETLPIIGIPRKPKGHDTKNDTGS